MTANQLIAQNRQQYEAGNYEAAKRLDLGNCGLTDLETQVPELFTLTHLKELVLSNWWWTLGEKTQYSQNKGMPNKLSQLPDAFEQLKQLKVLVCAGNRDNRWAISDLNVLQYLPNLQQLDISSNKISKIERLDNLPSLQQLDISYNQISKLENLDNLPSLQQLDISSNKISKIERLDNLPSLQQLNISHNQITKLENLDKLPNLQELNISSNKITKLENLDGLPNLQQLELIGNQITKLENLDKLPNLQQLDVRSNQITKLENLDKLPNLQQLNISSNVIVKGKITKLENLDKLPNLQQLNISSNQITKIESTVDLPSLQRLDLGSNLITKLENLDKLPSLQQLNIWDNKITKLENLDKLPNLQQLDVRSNQITKLENLDKLPNLQQLNLSYNRISNLENLDMLPSLQELDISGNKISKIGNLDKLTNLQELYIDANKISKLENLDKLTNLQQLDIKDNKITKLENLDKLPSLQQLDIKDNKITKLENLDKLPSLQQLDISWNQITKIESTVDLPSLQGLGISGNKITNLENLDKLPNLQGLGISGNKITNLENLDKLPNLQELYISDNKISKLENLDKLPNLQQLDISNNQISSNISLEFLGQFKQLNDLNLQNNPLGNIPSGIDLEGNCLYNLRRYLLDMEEGGEANNEVKVLLIGNGNVGKTQIAKRLALQAGFEFNDEHDSTHGITLLQRSLACNFLPKGLLQLNLWDFGGQDLYHATHRLFMRTRALFLLVWDIESEHTNHIWKGHEYRNEKLPYWLAYAHYFAANSPILVVQNKIDAPPANLPNPYPEPVQNELKAEYPAISNFVGVSAKSGKGFMVLEDRIATIFEQNDALKADLLNKRLPKTWIAVRDRIRQEQQNPNGEKEISFATFEQWCKDAGIPQSATTLLGFLHNTGVLYYQSNYFGGRIIIDQAWAINAVYKILDRQGKYYELLEDNKGKVSYKDIVRIWAENTDEERELFLDFMLSAELCFETTPNNNKEGYTSLEDRTFVVPQLLPKDAPYFVQTLDASLGAILQKTIEYRFLPSVFIQRFIIKAHSFSDQRYMWQHGIALQHNNNAYAVVRAYYFPPQYAITINYNAAAEQTGLLQAIVNELENLQNEDSNKPNAEAKINGFDALRAFGKATPNNHNNNDNNRTENKTKPLNLFISYSQKDVGYKQALETHLAPLKRDGLISTWSDQELIPGEEWDREIQKNLTTADIILLLVSANFIATDYIWDKEMTRAIERHEKEEAKVVPIILSPCDWQSAPFAILAALPAKGKPISNYANQDDAWTEVVTKLRDLINQINSKS